ncbi:c6 transcription factor [Trichoderma arundinaceum]|uniref:C6 transcription factor n=1 Tax=Trichoderma arundinaceum TaxID=490622 RepID=A0A395NKF0_TRIAR|nr:c6 transcription factor [Trichoderma arundinaceum]
MGSRMGLFGANPGEPLRVPTEVQDDEKWAKAASFTAWGCIAFITKLPKSKHPQGIPLPGENTSDTASAGDVENNIVNGATNFLVLRACCQLWAIFNPVLWTYYAKGSDHHPTWEFAKKVYRELFSWASSLHPALTRSDESSHAETIMHMYLHAMIVDLFRPFLPSSSRSGRPTSNEAISEAIYGSSINQLKRLLLTFRQKFKSASYSIFWQTGLIYVSNAMIREIGTQNAEWRFYLELCLAGIEDFGAAFSFEDAHRVQAELHNLGRHHTARLDDDQGSDEENIEATWIFDLELGLEDHEAAQGGRPALKLEEMILMDRFTTDGAEQVPT